jgi:DNA polymerase-3 subunit delta'
MWRTTGHEKAINTLKRGFGEGRVAHSFLIAGPAQIGKMTLALDLARMVNCIGHETPCGECGQCRRIDAGLHPDVHVIGIGEQKGREGRSRVSIGIDQVRELQKEASLKPYEGRHRVFIIDGAELLSEEASNSLLKTLEEPPDQVIFVLLASEPDGLLSTILSRCQRLDLKPLPLSQLTEALQKRYEVETELAQEIARLSGGRPGWAFQMLEQPDLMETRGERLTSIEELLRSPLDERFSYASDLSTAFTKSRDSVREEMQLWLEWWRDVLVTKEGVPQFVTNLSRKDALEAAASELSSHQIVNAIKAIHQAMEYLERNVNSRLALEELMLSLPRV